MKLLKSLNKIRKDEISNFVDQSFEHVYLLLGYAIISYAKKITSGSRK